MVAVTAALQTKGRAGKVQASSGLRDRAHKSVLSSEMSFGRAIYLKGVTDTWISALPIYVRGFPEEKTHTVETNWIEFLGVLSYRDCCNTFSFSWDNAEEETDYQMLKRSMRKKNKTKQVKYQFLVLFDFSPLICKKG